MGIALLEGCIVIRGNFSHTMSHLPYRIIDKLKIATATLDRFFGLPTGLFCIDCYTAELGPRDPEGLGAGLK